MARGIKLNNAYLLIFSMIAVVLIKSYCWAENNAQEYVIGHEDVLEVAVWKNQDLSRQVNVRPDGMISLPLIGDVRAAGQTTEELRKVLVRKFKEYQENAVITIIVREITAYRVYIMGEVTRPGVYTFRTKPSLVQAISLAGGFTQYASKNDITIIREKADNRNKSEKIKVSFKEILKDGSPDKNPFLETGDTIIVP